MSFRWKAGAAALAALFLALQLVPVSRTNPPAKFEVTAPTDVMRILDRACFDCHSNRTRWPWYSKVAPVSWWVVRHVDEGRKDLNFSDWPAFDEELRGLAMKDIEAQIDKGEMPLRGYALGHPEARLSDEDRELLLGWARRR